MEHEKPFNSLLSRTKDSLDFIAWLFPLSPRPKCLLILCDADELSNDHFAEILLLTWHLKFLDFSIISVNDAFTAEIWNYNPFSITFDQSKLTVGAQIFPDKLQNMHGYTLKFPLIHVPPNTVVKSDNDSLIVTGTQYPYFQIFSQTLNFRLDILPNNWELNTLSFRDNITSFSNIFMNQDMDGLMAALVSQVILMENRPFTPGNTFFAYQVGLTVPIMRTDSIEFPWGIGLVLVIPILLVILMRPIGRLAKLPRFEYGIMDMYRNFLGWANYNEAKRRIRKISLISVFIVSLVFSSEVFTILTGIRVVTKELELDTFEQMNDANLTLHVPRYYSMTARSYDNVAFQKLLGRAEISSNPHACFFKLAETGKYACVGISDRAHYYIRQQRPPRTMKVSKAVLFSDVTAFPYQKGSPYADKLSEIQQRIVEGGLPKFRIPLWGYEEPNSTYDDSKRYFDTLSLVVSDSQILTALMVVSTVGFGSAFVAFIVEQFYHFYCKK